MFKGIGRPLSIETAPQPVPNAGEVLLEVGFCGICGTDLHCTEIEGAAYPVGTVLGHEYSGEVVEVGKDVGKLKLGDRVVAQPFSGCGKCRECLDGNLYWCANRKSSMGGFGEFVIAAERAAVKLPAGVSLADAALVEPLAAALNGVHSAHCSRGARVLIIGAGAMGMGCTFWARQLGAGRIVVASRSDSHAQLAYSLGANAFLKTGRENFTDAVNQEFAGAPDLVFECAGAPGTLELAVNCVKPRGTVAALGLCMVPDPWRPVNALRKQVRIQFAAAYSMLDFIHCVDTLAAGTVEPRAMISDTIGLNDLPDTFEALRRPSGQCKVLVDPWKASGASTRSVNHGQ